MSVIDPGALLSLLSEKQQEIEFLRDRVAQLEQLASQSAVPNSEEF